MDSTEDMKKYYRCARCNKFLGEVKDIGDISLNGKIVIKNEEIIIKCSCGEITKIKIELKTIKKNINKIRS